MDQHTQRSEGVRLWSGQTAPFILSTLMLMTCIAVEAFAVSTVLPVAMDDLGGTTWYSFAFAATISTSLVGLVIGGSWSDRSGPRPPLFAGGTLFLLGLGLCALAPNAAVFIVGRLLQGVGGGIDSVVLYVLIARMIPAPSRPAMFGLLTTAWLLPAVVGPVVAGSLAELITWRVVFLMVLLGSAAALTGLICTAWGEGAPGREPGTEMPLIIGRKGALAAAAAGLLVILHLGAQLQGPTGVAVILVGLLVLVPVARRILPPGTLRLRGAAQRLVVLRAGFGVSSVVPDVYLTLYLQAERGLTPTQAGMVIAAGAGGWVLGSWGQSRIPSTQADHRRLILVAAPLVAVAPLGVLLLTLDLVPVAVVVGTAVVKGLGMGIASARTSTATLDLAPAQEQGTYSSALQAGESIGVAAVTAVMASILVVGPGAQGSYVAVYIALSVLAVVMVVIAAGSPRVRVDPVLVVTV